MAPPGQAGVQSAREGARGTQLGAGLGSPASTTRSWGRGPALAASVYDQTPVPNLLAARQATDVAQPRTQPQQLSRRGATRTEPASLPLTCPIANAPPTTAHSPPPGPSLRCSQQRHRHIRPNSRCTSPGAVACNQPHMLAVRMLLLGETCRNRPLLLPLNKAPRSLQVLSWPRSHMLTHAQQPKQVHMTARRILLHGPSWHPAPPGWSFSGCAQAPHSQQPHPVTTCPDAGRTTWCTTP